MLGVIVAVAVPCGMCVIVPLKVRVMPPLPLWSKHLGQGPRFGTSSLRVRQVCKHSCITGPHRAQLRPQVVGVVHTRQLCHREHARCGAHGRRRRHNA